MPLTKKIFLNLKRLRKFFDLLLKPSQFKFLGEKQSLFNDEIEIHKRLLFDEYLKNISNTYGAENSGVKFANVLSLLNDVTVRILIKILDMKKGAGGGGYLDFVRPSERIPPPNLGPMSESVGGGGGGGVPHCPHMLGTRPRVLISGLQTHWLNEHEVPIHISLYRCL